jgi:hypothetical protein
MTLNTDVQKIKLDEEFQSIIPPLKLEEYQQLEANILDEGCREALILWGGILVDGHNRYKICQEHDIPFKTCQLDFEDRRSVRMWIRNNQLGRRNLEPAVRIRLVLANEGEVLKEKGRERKVEEGKRGRDKQLGVLSTVDKTPDKPHNTRQQIAAKAGVSPRQVAEYDVVKKQDPELLQKVLNGDRTLHGAYTEVLDKKNRDIPLIDQSLVKSVGILYAHEAINALKKIPLTDPNREKGFITVRDWVDFNLKGQSNG